MRSHSTTTALTQIYNILYKNHENDKISAVVPTDLSSAFETVNSDILCCKLEHYGIRGAELKIFRSFLTDRKQFVQIDTFNSDILDSPSCSVIQGSKLSGVLFTCYVNEVTLLHKLMSQHWYKRITGKTLNIYNDIIHDTVNFEDDSTHIIHGTNYEDINGYLNDFYDLIHNF